ncbi:hypothetical protein IGS73_07575 [Janibacter indicus]|uniref:Uncharacterized protein n=1 Tax=Janibacter indicus TaxID=857417 RepID=A0A7L9J4I5_9MICO|nr:hypothetical protein [Janibacter indicus]QOK24209.1 hypothetical protein IGS73_07575 [Janibacter indicus]
MTGPTHQDGNELEVLASVVRLLGAAADRAREISSAEPDLLLECLGLGASITAGRVYGLLPEGLEVEDLPVAQSDPFELVRAAESLMRTHPLEQFPPGTAHVVVEICDLVREHCP